MTHEMTKREKWQQEYITKLAMAREELHKFNRERDWEAFHSYEKLMKEVNKAFGIMLRCGTRNPNI